MNVPETMNEVLDMSDDDGQDSFHISFVHCCSSLMSRISFSVAMWMLIFVTQGLKIHSFYFL